MFKKGLKIIFTLLGLVVGYIIAEAILAINTGLRINIIKGVVATTIFYILSVLLFGIIFYFISFLIFNCLNYLFYFEFLFIYLYFISLFIYQAIRAKLN